VPQITLSEQASLEAQYLQAVNRATLWAGGAAALAAMLLAWVLVRSITAPLRDLTQATEALAGGDLARRVAVRGSDEINDLARSFNAMAQSLQEQTTLRRHMVADIAHELRTPLSVLRGNLEAMLDGVYPLSTDNIAVAHHQTLHLNRLVEDLRLLALAEAGALELQRVAVDLNDLVRESGQAFEAVADDAAVTLEVVPAETPLPLLADRQRLRQVCFNLLQNALQHTPAGGRITLRAWRGDQPPVPLPPAVAEALASGAWQVLEVSDTGQGIPAEDLPHIFERFRRGSQAAPGSGSGLGLAIARQLTLAHGGQIIAQSVLGQGTTFCVLLPAVDEA
ncbi:MAG: HAMP domain-containing histidine kinase, partial [Chloroflexi bacterium]|nr:HAMP domain-containing histidine kinase [Chloroflexota bacterium]